MNQSRRLALLGLAILLAGTLAACTDKGDDGTAESDPMTKLAATCPSFPAGTIPGYATPEALFSNSSDDPSTESETASVGFSYAEQMPAPGYEALPQFSFVMVFDNPTDNVNPQSNGLAIDRLGTQQLWFTWTGDEALQGVRVYTGEEWVTLSLEEAGSPYAEIGDLQAQWWWADLSADFVVGAVTVTDNGDCGAVGLGTDNQPGGAISLATTTTPEAAPTTTTDAATTTVGT